MINYPPRRAFRFKGETETHHCVTEQLMDLKFLPKRLVSFCNVLVDKHHHQHGYSDLVRFLWHKDTMGFIAIHEDLFTLLGALLHHGNSKLAVSD